MSARILIADDDRAIREALTRALTLEGYDVVQAPDGAQALSLIESSKPDAAVLDVMMPNVDGLTVCGRDDRTDVAATTQVVLKECGPLLAAYTDCTSRAR